jgi:hypothetical protein
MSQINTNWTQTETPAFIPNKWAESLGFKWSTFVPLLIVGTYWVSNFCQQTAEHFKVSYFKKHVVSFNQKRKIKANGF